VCELASRFNEKVWMHLVFEDNTIYSELAAYNNPDISTFAHDFHDNAKAIKKDFPSTSNSGARRRRMMAMKHLLHKARRFLK